MFRNSLKLFPYYSECVVWAFSTH